MKISHKHRRGNRRPTGAILAIVLVVVAVLVVLAAVMTTRTVRYHRVRMNRANAIQSQLLADAGLDRALLRLKQDSDYAGETWTVPVDLLDGHQSATVTIQVDRADAARKVIKVTSQFPVDSIRSVQRTIEYTWPLESNEESE
ncbi:MAG: hypothetical protein KDA87_08220 [Planctomycetales bacterium]|nr:hypothetical protein [Planctomycetales bacterium]